MVRAHQRTDHVQRQNRHGFEAAVLLGLPIEQAFREFAFAIAYARSRFSGMFASVQRPS